MRRSTRRCGSIWTGSELRARKEFHAPRIDAAHQVAEVLLRRGQAGRFVQSGPEGESLLGRHIDPLLAIRGLLLKAFGTAGHGISLAGFFSSA
jgi:hypothetical protein